MWKIIEMPVYAMVAWAAFTLFIPLENYVGQTVFSIVGWLVNLGVFGWVGYNAMHENKKLGFASKCGAFSGAVGGFLGALVGIVAYNVVPERFVSTVQQIMAASPQMTEEAAIQALSIGMYVGVLTGPIVSALIGAVIAMFFAWVFSK